RRDPETVGSLLVANAAGVRLPLRELADVELATGRDSILHEGARRRQTVNCNTRGRDVASFVAEARKQIAARVHYPPEQVYLVYQEGMTWGLDAATRGASERLVPILMTALVTGLGLLPLAIGTGEAGREIEGPMALVILGGLLTSTALNLLVLPTLALRYGRFGEHSGED